jgi:glyoxylase-like metal-dependent hydrolase (beta-lactamase superfamily II)
VTKTEEVLPGILRLRAPNPGPLTGSGTNTWLFGARELVVLDPGPADERHIAAILAAANARGGRITHIVCTHTHEDHSPGAALLAQATGAQQVGNPAPEDGYNDTSFAPDYCPRDAELLAVGDVRLRAIATPGHVSNHLCFLLEEQGLLFTGDHLIEGTTVVIVPPEGSMRDYLASLERLRAWDLACIAPGHGELMHDPQVRIDTTIRHRLMREARVMAALRAQGPSTIDELLPAVYNDVPVFMHPVARLSLEAHLVKLLEDGAVSGDDGGRWRA